MRIVVPDNINTDYLLPGDEVFRILKTLPSTIDRTRLLSHSVVSAALVRMLVNDEVELVPEREVPAPVAPAATPVAPSAPAPAAPEVPWAWSVVDANGVFLSGHTSRSKARAACNRGAGQKVKNLRNPNGKG